LTTIQLTSKEQKAVASMISVTNPKDHLAALTMVKLIANLDGTITLHATNRHIIAEQTFTPHNPFTLDGGAIEVLLTPNLLKAMKTSKYDGTLTITEDRITYATSLSPEITEVRPNAKFPDLTPHLGSSIDRSTIKHATSFLRVNLDLITAISKLVSTEDFKGDDPVFDMFTQEDRGIGKPQPILFKRANILAVVQPMYVK